MEIFAGFKNLLTPQKSGNGQIEKLAYESLQARFYLSDYL
jgi:hypothetical protein